MVKVLHGGQTTSDLISFFDYITYTQKIRIFMGDIEKNILRNKVKLIISFYKYVKFAITEKLI